MQACPKCGSPPQYSEESTSGVDYFKCWSHTLGGELVQSFACARIASLSAEVERLQTLIDSPPAAKEADGRWETLRKWLPVVADDWDRAGMPQKKFAVAYIIDTMDQIDAVISAPSPPAAEGAERPERPPMLLAELAGFPLEWWIRHKGAWRQTSGCEARSQRFTKVDRIVSDQAALKIYDNDISNSGPAAQQTGAGDAVTEPPC